MNNWTVRSQIVVGFFAVILIMAVLSVFALFRLSIIKTRTTVILTDALPSLTAIGRVESLSKEHYGLVERRVLTSNTKEERRTESDITTVSGKLDEAFSDYEKTIYTGEEHQLYNAMTDARKAYTNQVTKLLDMGRSLNPAEATGALEREIDPAYQAYTKAIQAGVSVNQRYGDESGSAIHDAVDTARSGILLALAIGVILACVSGYLLIQAINNPLARVVEAIQVVSGGDFSRRLSLDGKGEFGVLSERLNHMASDLTSLIGSVKDSGLRVDTSATQIASTAQEQLAAANEVAATTAEVGATSKEISATAKELMQTVKGVTAVAEETAAVAASGQTSLTRMKNTMQQIVEASASINSKLAILSEKAGSIGTVITTITKVADQTNLLSLNAAIEAEKAGEYGRGFSVVATEIRRLADQSALATTDIEQMVQDIQSAVSAGVMGMDKFSEEVRRGVDMVQHVSDELSHIILQVQNLTASFETVSDGMQSQAAGAQQISEALMQLTEASRQTVESLRQSNLAIEQLNTASRTMQHGVARFTLAG